MIGKRLQQAKKIAKKRMKMRKDAWGWIPFDQEDSEKQHGFLRKQNGCDCKACHPWFEERKYAGPSLQEKKEIDKQDSMLNDLGDDNDE